MQGVRPETNGEIYEVNKPRKCIRGELIKTEANPEMGLLMNI